MKRKRPSQRSETFGKTEEKRSEKRSETSLEENSLLLEWGNGVEDAVLSLQCCISGVSISPS